MTDVLAYLVVRSVVQKSIWTKSGQPMLGLGARLALELGSIIFLTSALPAPTSPTYPSSLLVTFDCQLHLHWLTGQADLKGLSLLSQVGWTF